MIKRSTWILLALLALVIGAYLVIKDHAENQPTIVPTSDKIYLFYNDDETVKISSIRIQSADGNYIVIKRNPDGQWVIQAPVRGDANQSTMTMAETQIYALGVKTVIDTPQDLDVIGLNTPTYTFEISFSNGVTSIFEVGIASPTGDGYYVRMGDKIYVVYQYNIDALANLLTNPPYSATLTPIPPTETPTPVSPTETPSLIPTETASLTPEPIVPTGTP